jgi:hypothetical protein
MHVFTQSVGVPFRPYILWTPFQKKPHRGSDLWGRKEWTKMRTILIYGQDG